MPDADTPRLIEVAFPLKQASLDSVHEKSVRHGHISTLHIWPARRPLAACRAALIATLLPDPGTPQGRKELLEKIGGKVVTEVQKKKVGGKTVETVKERTEGGVLHWGSENNPDMDWFRAEIRKAYGGRAPRVLDPFAGGGAIPLEAMRLGCEATAIDINPVAWLVLKCTLSYPQQFAGRTWPLPAFAVESAEFMESFQKSTTGKRPKRSSGKNERQSQMGLFQVPEADLSWHLRAWGQWVHQRATADLERYYPKIDGKPTVAYLWARTVRCKNCRAVVPLLKTKWLCKKDNKRVLLDLTPHRPDSQTQQQPVRQQPVERASVPADLIFSQYRRNLPHWRLTGATYFVTWRIHKSQTDLTPAERDAVVAALRHFDGDRYELLAFVVMNDHVHVLVKPHGEYRLEQILHSWKSFTARQLQRERGRVGPVWQDESFDRIVRDEDEFWEKAKYILDNPAKRWPGQGDYAWVGLRNPDADATANAAGTEARTTQTNPPMASRGDATTSQALGRQGGAMTSQTLECQGGAMTSQGGAGVPARDPSIPWIEFRIHNDVPVVGSNASERRAHDKAISAATMTRSGTTCPFCSTIMTWDDLRIAGQAKAFGSMMFAVVVDSSAGKSYRTPTDEESRLVEDCGPEIERLFATIPFGLPTEATPGPSGPKKRGSSLRNYGLDSWVDLFTPRQLLALGTFVKHTRAVRGAMLAEGVHAEIAEAVTGYLALAVDRLADYSSSICSWHNSGEKLRNTFGRFAFPIVWDFAEVVPTSQTSGSYLGAIEWIGMFIAHALAFPGSTPRPSVIRQSSIQNFDRKIDIILTDPPYYDAIPYSDLMDFFHVWLRRSLFGLSPAFDEVYLNPLGPKWDHATNDGELVDDPARHGWDLSRSKSLYEDGMFRTFQSCYRALEPDGRLVIVFAHKYPDAWETLVSAIIRAGYVVDGSWPIQTEMINRTRALSSSALSSSVWLVCKKRPESARPGWDNRVLDEMRHNIHTRLREYWDAGIRGPDFVWAATGPAMEAYSKHPVVKKANEPGKLMEVGEFLRAVRRLVVDFVVGRVLTGDGDETSASGLDDITTYYVLHRHDFGLEDAPVGACILYAVSCNLSDSDLANRHEILLRTGGLAASQDEDDPDDKEDADTDPDAEPEQGTGSTVKLRPWHQRKRKSLGYDAEGHPAPLIDQAHRMLHLWKAGDVVKVDEYLDARGLRKNALFLQLLQALIELAGEGTEERAILETISNHLVARGVSPVRSRTLPGLGDAGDGE